MSSKIVLEGVYGFFVLGDIIQAMGVPFENKVKFSLNVIGRFLETVT